MAILGFEIEEIQRALALMDTSELEEIVWEEEGRYLRIRSPYSPPVFAPNPISIPAPTAPQPLLALPKAPTPASTPSVAPPDVPAEDQIVLTAPMVGVFYRSPKPGDPNFIEVGQRISQEQTIGIIEAMKIFSEIPAEHSGIVIAIPAPDGQMVREGTPLVILKKGD